MKSKFQIFAGLFAMVLVLFVTSCKKEGSLTGNQSVSDEEAQTISEENAAAEAEYDDITEIGFSAGSDLETVSEANKGETPAEAAGAGLALRIDLLVDLKWKIGPCTTVTVSPDDSTFPKTVIIDYGEGCLCRDGRFRKGAIVLTFSAPIRRPGAELQIELRDYYVNRAHIEGKKTIVNQSTSSAIAYSVKIENGAITWPNGRGFKFESSKTVTQVEGRDTRTIRDDVYSVSGRSQLTYNSGLTVTRNTEEPLIKPVACGWFVKGVLKVVINDRVLYIDFENGECDNLAILKWAGGEREIRLP